MTENRLSLRDLKQIVSAWEAAGLDTATLEGVTAKLNRLNAIREEASEIQAAGSTINALVPRIVAGDVSLTDAMIQSAAAAAWRQPVSSRYGHAMGFALMDAIEKSVEASATVWLKDNAGRLISEHVVAGLEAVNRDASKLPAEVYAMTAETAARAKLGEAWARVQGVEQRHRLLIAVAKQLRLHGLIDQVPNIRLDTTGRTKTAAGTKA